MRKALLPFLAACSAVLAQAADVVIDAEHPAGRVSPLFHGLMTEEINHSYDGGLYAELVQNRAFLDSTDSPVHWSLQCRTGDEAVMALDRQNPLNSAIPVSLRVEARHVADGGAVGISNDGYWGVPVHPHTQYRCSLHAKASGYTGPLRISLESENGATVYASARTGALSADWGQQQLVLQTGDLVPTAKARLVVRLEGTGTVWLSLVSLFPPTWKDRPNGLRRDLMQMLVDLKPKFLRFPGGNYLEGNKVAERFPWKATLGPLSERPGHPCNWGYRSSDGMGLLEFLEWSEDLGAEPILAVYAGYSLTGERVAAGKDLEPYVQEALEEIEYVMGDARSTHWGAQRAKDGHPAPFSLHYVEIGNEDGFDGANTYDARFTQLADAIRAKYPGLQCISSTGQHEAEGKRVASRTPDLCDEHYYNSFDGFLSMSRSYYDVRDRKDRPVFVGEWATFETDFPPWDNRSWAEPATPNLRAAVADAVFLTHLERNADLVVMNCYAPLLANINPGARQWRPNLIGYDALQAYASPSYYVIRMFSNHTGEQILKVGSSPSPLYCSATREEKGGTIYLKMVNPGSRAERAHIRIPGTGTMHFQASVEVLASGSPQETNSMTAPKAVVPVRTDLGDLNLEKGIEVPANGIVVLSLTPRASR